MQNADDESVMHAEVQRCRQVSTLRDSNCSALRRNTARSAGSSSAKSHLYLPPPIFSTIVPWKRAVFHVSGNSSFAHSAPQTSAATETLSPTLRTLDMADRACRRVLGCQSKNVAIALVPDECSAAQRRGVLILLDSIDREKNGCLYTFWGAFYYPTL